MCARLYGRSLGYQAILKCGGIHHFSLATRTPEPDREPDRARHRSWCASRYAVATAEVQSLTIQNRWLLLSVATTGYVTSEENKTKGPFLRKAPPLSAHTLTKALRSSLQENFGDVAAGTLGGPLTCKFYSPKTGTCIVRCAREGAELVWAAATLTTAIEGIHVRICVRHCGGTCFTSVLGIAYARHHPQSTAESHCAGPALYLTV